MLIRFALFLSLLALFYYYCKDETTTNQLREPVDLNMIDVPGQRLSPSFEYELVPEADWNSDSTSYFVSTRGTDSEITRRSLSSAQ